MTQVLDDTWLPDLGRDDDYVKDDVRYMYIQGICIATDGVDSGWGDTPETALDNLEEIRSL